VRSRMRHEQTVHALHPSTLVLNSVIKLTCAKSVCTATKPVCTDAKSICTGAELLGTELKSLSMVAVSVLPPIVPGPTAKSRSAVWLNQWCHGRRTGYAHAHFDRIQQVFNSVSHRQH
jgi:hypothetical protein